MRGVVELVILMLLHVVAAVFSVVLYKHFESYFVFLLLCVALGVSSYKTTEWLGKIHAEREGND